MKLTPLDLQNKTFRKTRFGGVDAAEVDAFLDVAASEMEELVRKLHAQEEELRHRAARIAEYREGEVLLKATLTTAQKLTEEMKAQSRREAELALADAELQAEKIIANAQAKRLQLVGEIEELKRAKTAFVSQLAALIETHRAMLETHRSQDAQEPPRVNVPAQGDNVSFLAPPGKRLDSK
jgi:cell division initiation protein